MSSDRDPCSTAYWKYSTIVIHWAEIIPWIHTLSTFAEPRERLVAKNGTWELSYLYAKVTRWELLDPRSKQSQHQISLIQPTPVTS